MSSMVALDEALSETGPPGAMTRSSTLASTARTANDRKRDVIMLMGYPSVPTHGSYKRRRKPDVIQLPLLGLVETIRMLTKLSVNRQMDGYPVVAEANAGLPTVVPRVHGR